MALVIHRRRGPARPQRRPRLLLVGGDGRWARPLLRLVEALGFAPQWLERGRPLEERTLRAHDLVIAGDPDAAAWVLSHRRIDGGPPVVVMTGSLLGLSTAIPGQAVALPLPVTRESLTRVLGGGGDPGSSEAAA